MTASRTVTVNNTVPTVLWSSPPEGATVSGSKYLAATAAASGTAEVTRACLTINGQVPAADYSDSYTDLDDAYYDSGKGCWTSTSALDYLDLRVDFTPWTNGNYTFAWTVTDSNGRTGVTASRTVVKR